MSNAAWLAPSRAAAFGSAITLAAWLAAADASAALPRAVARAFLDAGIPLSAVSAYVSHQTVRAAWKMPYIAETRAMATNPTTRPTMSSTAGSKRLVNLLIL